MTSQNSLTFRAAAGKLHRGKSAAYGNAWKRRGETISIIANIARKVDRLESVAGGATATQDESIVDTAVDLFVYVLKYLTFLADQDKTVAYSLFAPHQLQSPYSDGTEAFEVLLAKADLAPIEEPPNHSVAEATQTVLNTFVIVESSFVEPLATVSERVERATELETAAVALLGVLHRDAPERYDDFLVQQSQG